MGRRRYWDKDNLYWLLNEDIGKLRVRYPTHDPNKLRALKRYHTKKLRKDSSYMPPKPEGEPTPAPEGKSFDDVLKLHDLSPDQLASLTDRGFHVGFIKNSEGEIEYTMPLPHARGSQKTEVEFDPAEPANIRPTKRKPKKREHNLLFAFSDAQVDYRRLEDGTLEPIHDERAIAVATMMCADLMPDVIVNCGDTVDLAVLSRFKPDSDHFHRTLGPSFQRVHDMYAQLRADSPDARIVEVDSNHNTRLKKFLLDNNEAWYGFKRPGEPEDEFPVNTYPYLANLRVPGVEWVSGYGAAEFVYGEEYDTPPIVFKHGNTMVSAGSTANKESKGNPETNVVRGHGHRMETHTRTNRAGQYLASVMIGALCRIDGAVPSYHSAVDDRGKVVKQNEDWQNGVLVIHDYDGQYTFDHVPIQDGVAYYMGKKYDGTGVESW